MTEDNSDAAALSSRPTEKRGDDWMMCFGPSVCVVFKYQIAASGVGFV